MYNVHYLNILVEHKIMLRHYLYTQRSDLVYNHRLDHLVLVRILYYQYRLRDLVGMKNGMMQMMDNLLLVLLVKCIHSLNGGEKNVC
jgi:hypothetical protein